MRVFTVGSIDRVAAAQDDARAAWLREVAALEGATRIAVDVIEIAAGGTIPLHHGRRHQICLVVSGTGAVAGAGVASQAVAEGAVVRWEPGEPRAVHAATELRLFSVRAAVG